MYRLLATLVLLGCGSGPKARGNFEKPSPPLENENNFAFRHFADQFYSDENLASCIATIDVVINDAEAKANSTLRSVSTDGAFSKAQTDNGIKVEMSVIHLHDSVRQVSFSHPYLAPELAGTIAALIASRGGLDYPKQILSSPNGEFHVQWFMPNSAKVRKHLEAARIKAQAVVAPNVILPSIQREAATAKFIPVEDRILLPRARACASADRACAQRR